MLLFAMKKPSFWLTNRDSEHAEQHLDKSKRSDVRESTSGSTCSWTAREDPGRVRRQVGIDAARGSLDAAAGSP